MVRAIGSFFREAWATVPECLTDEDHPYQRCEKTDGGYQCKRHIRLAEAFYLVYTEGREGRLQDEALRRIVTTVEECAESVLHIANSARLSDSDNPSDK